MSIPKMTNDLAVIQRLSDLPNSTEGLTADQLKAKFDEAPLAIQEYINNRLIPAIVAAQIPFTATSEINADNIDAAIREVQSQVRDASSGTIVNGSVTAEKLSVELLARTYGGRPWVSMDTPDSADNVAADFPIGQIWLRPAFTVANAAGADWTLNGLTSTSEENKITFTGNNTVTVATATQALTNLGQDGDRVYVLFSTGDVDSEIGALTVSLNSGEAQNTAFGVYAGTLMGGSLTVQFSATWPSTSLAGGSFAVNNYTVVNVDQIIRQTDAAQEIADWPGYLSGLLPLSSYTSKEEAFIQSINGNWWPLSYSVQPVSRGGTGNGTVAYGEMLYGTGNEAMERLGAASENNSFLQFVGGKPAWVGASDAAGNNGIARIVTGSYRGTGIGRSVSLPVTPKLLHISTPSGCWDNGGYSGADYTEWSDHPVTLAQGCADTSNYAQSVDGGTRQMSETVRLNGSSVSVGQYFCNRSGVNYNWVAIY